MMYVLIYCQHRHSHPLFLHYLTPFSTYLPIHESMADSTAPPAFSPPEEPQKTFHNSPETAMTKSDSALPMIKLLLPKVPLIAKTALYHILGFSEHSKEWDLRSEVTVNVLRSFVVDSPPQSVTKTQHMLNKDPGVKGRIWVATAKLPAPEEDNARQELFKAIEQMKEPGELPGGFKEPELLPVEAEWTGYRANATSSSVPPKITEEEKYKELMKEVSSPVTVLYFHGGAYYLLDPSSHRPTTKKLAKLTKGRVLSVRYRLAPQNPFPAALLDALVVYFNLIYPTSRSFHEAVAPGNIVLGGDSAGGNLCLVLIQTLLQFRRSGLKLQWNGQERDVPLPGGCSLSSAWCDIVHSSPSCKLNGSYDYLPIPDFQSSREFPPCSAWPTNPPRNSLYAEDAVLCHPLVSPIAARSWEGCCPLFITCGQELLTDENKYLAAKASSQGVTVVYKEFKASPHCFAMVLPQMAGATKMVEWWSNFISDVVERPETVKTVGTVIKAKTLEENNVDVKSVSDFRQEEVLERMKERVKKLSAPETLAKL